MSLTDTQWEIIEPLLQLPPKTNPRGRPRADLRSVMNGVLWILKTGAQWRELPRPKFPPYQTCHRYFLIWVKKLWVKKRILYKVLANVGLLCKAETCQRLGTTRWLRPVRMLRGRDFCVGEKGGSAVGPTKKGKGTKSRRFSETRNMAVCDRAGLPVAVSIHRASPVEFPKEMSRVEFPKEMSRVEFPKEMSRVEFPKEMSRHEVTLVAAVLDACLTAQAPQRLIGDRAYDSDDLDAQLVGEWR